MSQPSDVSSSPDQLIALYEQARDKLLAAVNAHSAKSTLTPLIRDLQGIIAELHDSTRNWVSGSLPGVYAAGATHTGLGGFAWNQAAVEAVNRLAHQNWGDIASTLGDVSESTRRALRVLSETGAIETLTGDTANRAGLNVTNRMQDAIGRVMTVRYENGSRHSLADWADMALRTQTALAYNHGALDQFRTHGIEWIEIADGPACGLKSHDDMELANGLIVPLSTAEAYPLSHPRCARSLIPRPDITSADGADEANSARDMDALEADAAAERARAAKGTVTGRRFDVGSEASRFDRRVRQGRVARTPRVPRTGRPARSVAGAAGNAIPTLRGTRNEQMAELDRTMPSTQIVGAQREAAVSYGNPENARKLNSAMRSDDPMDIGMAFMEEDLATAIADSALPKTTLLYRATGNFLGLDSSNASTFSGHRLTERGFMSTSVGGVTTDFKELPIQWMISAPAGTPALNMHQIQAGTPWEDENEILLPADVTLVFDGPPVYNRGAWLIRAHVER